MRSNYKRLGEYIELVSITNSNLYYGENDVIGVSNNKEIIKTIANNEGRDFNNFYIVAPDAFIYNSRTSRMGDKVGLGYNGSGTHYITSFNNTVFRVKNEDLLPMFLYMWFKRSEFDRYARFHSWGSSTEIFSWEEMCNTLLPVPDIDKQRELVKEFNTIVDRINLNNQLIQKLEETAQAIYKQWFVDFEFPDEEGKPYKSNGGEMEWNEELEMEVPRGWEVKKLRSFCDIKGGKRLPKGEELNDMRVGNPYIKVADMKKSKFITLDVRFQFVTPEIQRNIARYITAAGDVIISIVGTIGMVNIVHSNLHNANLTENCVRLTNIRKINSDFIYHFLASAIGQRLIETKTVGGVQGKLPLYNIEAIPVLFSTEDLMREFKSLIEKINGKTENCVLQNYGFTQLKELLLSKLATIEK